MKMSRLVLAALGVAAFVGIAFAADQARDRFVTDAAGSGDLERARAFDTSDYTVIPRVYFNYANATSYLRFANTSGQSTNFSLKIAGGESGTDYAPNQTYQVTVPDKASVQRSITDIRNAIIAQGGPDITPTGGDTFLNLYVHNDKAGPKVDFQHVSYNGLTGFFEDVSVCTYDPTQDYSSANRRLINVHTTQLSAYPSKIEINNPDTTARTVTGRVYDAVTGVSLGSFTATPTANATVVIDEASIEQQIGFHPTSSQLHIDIEFDTGDSSAYTALVGHKVQQTSTGVVFNLTQFCAINPKRTTSGSNCTAPTTNPSAGSSSGTTCTCSSTPSTNPSGSTSSGTGCTSGSAPVANNDTLTDLFTPGLAGRIDVDSLTFNDTNVIANTLFDTVTAFVDAGTTTPNGTFTNTLGTITYTPAHAGTVTFTYKVKNSNGTSGFATVTLTVGTGSGAPVANNDTLTLAFTVGHTTVIPLATLTANDSNTSGATFDLNTNPHFVDAGTSTLNGGWSETGTEINYSPARAGQITFSYQLKNSFGSSNVATVTLTAR